MVKPLFVRKLRNTELEIIKKVSRSNVAFSARRCQILLASPDGKKSSQIAKYLNCSIQTVRNTIHSFNNYGRLYSKKSSI